MYSSTNVGSVQDVQLVAMLEQEAQDGLHARVKDASLKDLKNKLTTAHSSEIFEVSCRASRDTFVYLQRQTIIASNTVFAGYRTSIAVGIAC